MLTLGVSELLRLKFKKPPGLISCEEEDFIEDNQSPDHKKVKKEKMSIFQMVEFCDVSSVQFLDIH